MSAIATPEPSGGKIRPKQPQDSLPPGVRYPELSKN